MSTLEQAAREAWLAGAAQARFGFCSCCGRHRGDDGRPLYVVRRQRARRFLCLECFDQPAARRAA